MVGPATDEEKAASMNRLKVGIVALVGLSAGLITLSGGGSVVEIALATGAGSAVGLALLLYLLHAI
ncbi:hypothetical protein BRC82_05125 [Halobacteriales archaeon QS_1_67_19]|nr:MAG: hypothetical protein BRC82_05125 [Halobacteriales archaeon QS_1_67_19]